MNLNLRILKSGIVLSMMLVTLLTSSCKGKSEGIKDDRTLNDLITKGNGKVSIMIPDGVTIKMNTVKLIRIDGKEVVIAGGKGSTIEGDGTSPLFEISSSGILRISGITLTNGKSKDSNGGAGGAICNYGELYIDSCIFKNNKATGGGAIANYAIALIDHSVFNENSAEVAGGAIFNYSKRNPAMIENCIFEKNKSASHGGAIYTENSLLTVNATTFSENKAESNGGAIYNVQGALIMDGRINQENAGESLVSKNHATNGGAIANNHGRIYIINGFTFKENIADHCGGALFNEESGIINLKNGTVVSGNIADQGGDLFNADGKVTLDQVTVTDKYGEHIVAGNVDLSPLIGHK